MAKVTIIYGVILVLLGFGAYGLGLAGLMGNKASPTALIPSVFGLILVLLGLVGQFKPSINMHVMHAAVLIALLGCLASAGMGIPKLIRYATDSLPPEAPVRVGAWVTQTLMAFILAVYVAQCVKSFISARRQRRLQSQA
ncbi:MAG: hypothetical protein KatS3mg104_0752 [Phycisphaerae bacterium]|jgi:hypothetical protein|nr:MAG: hypothetical protein KatS3mg104_0752 [Phycisphaerae bacterium]